jgi:hypothetical protein
MRISDFSLFLVSYWLNVLLFPVSNGGKESSRKTAGVTLCFPKARGEIHECWYDEIAVFQRKRGLVSV